MAHEKVVTLRFPTELVEAAEELVPRMKADPRYRTMPRLSRASVMRVAMDMGLHALRVHLETPMPGMDSWEEKSPGSEQ